MKVKKEVFESLRLELQEFTPQEYVAVCWSVTLECENDSDYSSLSNGSSHSTHMLNSSIHVNFENDKTTLTKNDIISAFNDVQITVMSGYAADNKGHLNQADRRTSGYIWQLSNTYHFTADSSVAFNSSTHTS